MKVFAPVVTPATGEYSVKQFNRAWEVLADQAKVDDIDGSEYHSTRNDWLAGEGTQEPEQFIMDWQRNMLVEADQRSVANKFIARRWFSGVLAR